MNLTYRQICYTSKFLKWVEKLDPWLNPVWTASTIQQLAVLKMVSLCSVYILMGRGERFLHHTLKWAGIWSTFKGSGNCQLQWSYGSLKKKPTEESPFVLWVQTEWRFCNKVTKIWGSKSRMARLCLKSLWRVFSEMFHGVVFTCSVSRVCKAQGCWSFFKQRVCLLN